MNTYWTAAVCRGPLERPQRYKKVLLKGAYKLGGMANAGAMVSTQKQTNIKYTYKCNATK